ncbi:MAG: DUF3450 family protein [Planctomycetes bacterium]|nr:DUF3450 family protein [Planctomycetota bacterium]
MTSQRAARARTESAASSRNSAKRSRALVFVAAVAAALIGAASADDAAGLAGELQRVLGQLRGARAGFYARQRALAADLERARQSARALEPEVADLKAREEVADRELASLRTELEGLHAEAAADANARAALAGALDQASAEAGVLLHRGSPYRREERAARLGGAADPVRPVSDRLGRYWAHVQEELRIARSGESYSAEVALDAGRSKPARLFRVGHLLLGYCTEDGRETGLWTEGGWRPARDDDEDARIRGAIDMLDRRRAPALLPFTVSEGRRP